MLCFAVSGSFLLEFFSLSRCLWAENRSGCRMLTRRCAMLKDVSGRTGCGVTVESLMQLLRLGRSIVVTTGVSSSTSLSG